MVELHAKGIQVPFIVSQDTSDERPWFVMPWYASGSLDGVIEDAALSTFDRLRLARDIGSIVSSVHSSGYSHRDLKPANILIADNGEPALTDFGLCISASEARLTETSEAVGSRYFIAPENESGINEEVDQRPADFYAFGKILWMLATGRQALARELHTDADNRIGRTVDERLNGLDQLVSLLANTDPRARLGDWVTVLGELDTQLELLSNITEAASDQGVGPRILERIRAIAASNEFSEARVQREVERESESLASEFIAAARDRFIDRFSIFINSLESEVEGIRFSLAPGSGSNLPGALNANNIDPNLWSTQKGGNSCGSLVVTNNTGVGITGELWLLVYPLISTNREVRLVRVMQVIDRSGSNGSAFIPTESGSFPYVATPPGRLGLPSALVMIDDFLTDSYGLFQRSMELFIESVSDGDDAVTTAGKLEMEL
jgi:serine/threonine protein kinase